MSRILKRPMFRSGGSSNEGIMHGLVDRRGYAEGSARKTADEVYDLMKEMVPAPKARFPIGQMGLNLISGEHAGEGLLQNIAGSARDPYARWTQADDEKRAYDRQLRMMAAKTGIEQQMTMEQIKAKENPQSALYNVYLKQAIESDYDAPEAQRIAEYQTIHKTDLQNKVGRNRVGGIIEFDLNDAKQTKKQLPKMKKDIGKYFYDPYDGKIKQLVEIDGKLNWRPFDSVDSIDFSPVSGVATETSTPYQDAQEFREQEKSEGILTDEDILAQRFP